MDRESYENYIKELIESDNSKKNEIEKLSLTIRSLIVISAVICSQVARPTASRSARQTSKSVRSKTSTTT